MTVEAFLERNFGEPLTPSAVIDGGGKSQWCFDLHRVRWNGSFLSLDGRTMICAFSAPDMESVRLAMRDLDTDVSRFWPGTLLGGKSGIVPNVVVERAFAAPARYEDIQALSANNAWCYETYDVKFSHTLFALDATRMLCFYSAPDAEAVRKVQREVGAPFSAVWAGTAILPAMS